MLHWYFIFCKLYTGTERRIWFLLSWRFVFRMTACLFHEQCLVLVQNTNEVDDNKRHDIPRHRVEKVCSACLTLLLFRIDEQREMFDHLRSTSKYVTHYHVIYNLLLSRSDDDKVLKPFLLIFQVICSLCDCEQDAKQVCENCGVSMGDYYCSKCKFFDDEVSIPLKVLWLILRIAA